MKKFKVGMMALVVLMLAASIGSVSAVECSGQIAIFNNGHNGAYTYHPITLDLTYDSAGHVVDWVIIKSGDYNGINHDDVGTYINIERVEAFPNYYTSLLLYISLGIP